MVFSLTKMHEKSPIYYKVTVTMHKGVDDKMVKTVHHFRSSASLLAYTECVKNGIIAWIVIKFVAI